MFKSIKDQTDEVLLVKLKRGNIRSFEAIYDRYAPMVLNFVRKIIKDQMRAEDITQNIFMRLYVSRNSLDPELSLKNWLFVCARNEALDVLRSKWAKDGDKGRCPGFCSGRRDDTEGIRSATAYHGGRPSGAALQDIEDE